MRIYCDANILLKRILNEPDSDTVERHLDVFLQRDCDLVTSQITQVEVERTVRRVNGERQPLQVEYALNQVSLLNLNSIVMGNAADVPYRYLPALDAIHVATAFTVSADLVLTLDKQMRAACEELGMAVGP
jgi:predicted nucleic acid-binding protein